MRLLAVYEASGRTEDFLAAKKNSENYGNLRVRVTGFSDYFVRLKESIQDDIIERAIQKK